MPVTSTIFFYHRSGKRKIPRIYSRYLLSSGFWDLVSSSIYSVNLRHRIAVSVATFADSLDSNINLTWLQIFEAASISGAINIITCRGDAATPPPATVAVAAAILYIRVPWVKFQQSHRSFWQIFQVQVIRRDRELVRIEFTRIRWN